MGKKYFSEEDILKLKDQEKGGGGGPGCSTFMIVIGLGLIIAGLFWADSMQGKTLTPIVTPFAVAETAVAHLATPTLAATATATATASAMASATAQPTETATAVVTHTPLPTQTPYPTYTPYPSATWTPQLPQATWTPQPTHTAQPTYTPYPTATATSTAEPTAVPVATDVPFLIAPLTNQADPPDPRAGGDGSPLPDWLIGVLVALVFTLIGLVAYVVHQTRPAPPAPVPITPEGVPVDTAPYGRQLPPPAGSPVRETRPAPVQAPVTPVTPPGAPVQNSTQRGQGAPPETIQVSVTDANPDTDEATMTALCAAWNRIKERGEQPSLNKLCVEYFGGKNSERMAIARRAVRWGRARGLIGNQNKQEVKQDDPTISDPKPAQATTRRGPVLINRHGRTALN
jgi:hypothetical protein